MKSRRVSKPQPSGTLVKALRLALLAPDILEAILAGRADQAMMLEHLERPLPANWEEQCQKLC